jgi:hypothetical protein
MFTSNFAATADRWIRSSTCLDPLPRQLCFGIGIVATGQGESRTTRCT